LAFSAAFVPRPMLLALVLAGLVALQLLATGYSLNLADGAAEAGAMALAAGKPAGPAVRDALPGWARGRSRVDVRGGRLTVSLEPPSPLPALHAITMRLRWLLQALRENRNNLLARIVRPDRQRGRSRGLGDGAAGAAQRLY
jgi:hypothetical protein